MLLLRAKREEEEEGEEEEGRRVYVAAVCSGLRSRLGVRTRAIWSQLEPEQRAPGPVLLEQPSARPFNPPMSRCREERSLKDYSGGVCFCLVF